MLIYSAYVDYAHAYLVPDNHGGLGTIVAEVEADLHAGVAAADNKHILAPELIPLLVAARVHGHAAVAVHALHALRAPATRAPHSRRWPR